MEPKATNPREPGRIAKAFGLILAVGTVLFAVVGVPQCSPPDKEPITCLAEFKQWAANRPPRDIWWDPNTGRSTPYKPLDHDRALSLAREVMLAGSIDAWIDTWRDTPAPSFRRERDWLISMEAMLVRLRFQDEEATIERALHIFMCYRGGRDRPERSEEELRAFGQMEIAVGLGDRVVSDAVSKMHYRLTGRNVSGLSTEDLIAAIRHPGFRDLLDEVYYERWFASSGGRRG